MFFLENIAFFIGFTILGYILQHGICRWRKNLFLRLLPGFLLLAATVCCAVPVIAIRNWENLIAFIGVFFLGCGLASMCLGCLIAWIVYLIGRNAQNQKK